MPSKPAFPAATISAALALIGQYGEDAEVIAVLRAAEFAAEGDPVGLAEWDEIIACIGAFEAGNGAMGPLQ